MRDWTEQEEQEMIERAKTGDPQANYELSLWAQDRSEEEPDEPRWNRLAAKCLVKAAQAGYGPAQERMAVILQQSATAKSGRASTPPSAEEDMPEPVHIDEVRKSTAGRRQASRQTAGTQQTTTARRSTSSRRPSLRKEPEEDYEDEEEEVEDDWGDEEDARPVRTARHSAAKKSGGEKSSSLPFGQWGESQWRKMELICIGICAILLIAIAVIFITGRSGGRSNEGTNSGVPAPGLANTNSVSDDAENDGQGAEPTATPEDYPDEDTLAAIRASDLEVLPAEQEYVLIPTTATVSVGNTTLRLRYGPSTTYNQVALDDGSRASMPDGTKVEVFAKKGDWWMVRYEGKFGWCSKEYLIEDAEASVG